jgi:cyanophycin synthetase
MRALTEILRKTPGARLVWRSAPVSLLRAKAGHLRRKLEPWLRTVRQRKTVRIMITGTKGKTTTTTMVARIMAQAGHRTGYCTTDNVVIDGRVVHVGDSAGQVGARLVLEDPSVTCAVLETARGDLRARGLYIATCRAAALLNIGWDHVGTDGIDTQEAMLAVKKRVTDASRGRVVLNVEDALVAPLVRDYGVTRTTFFARDPAAVAGHLAAGGEAVTLTEGPAPRIVHRGPAGDVEILPVADIPPRWAGACPSSWPTRWRPPRWPAR